MTLDFFSGGNIRGGGNGVNLERREGRVYYVKGGNRVKIDKEENKVNSLKGRNGVNTVKGGGNRLNSIKEEYGVT